MAFSVYEFNAPDSDIVLVSGEPEQPTEFRVHQCILAVASPFFKSMFTLPQSPAVDDQIPVVPVSEPRTTLDAILRFVYPIPDPFIDSLDDLAPVLGAAVKYDFVAIISTLRKILISPRFVQTAPTRVFAIACRYDFEEEAKFASRYTLGVNVLDCPLSDDLRHITAHSYHRLLDLHRQRARCAQELLKIPENVKCMQCNGSSYTVFAAPKWWHEFESRAKEELAARPTTDVIFDMRFLSRVANAVGCPRCPGSVMDSHLFLEDLKKSIDELPATI